MDIGKMSITIKLWRMIVSLAFITIVGGQSVASADGTELIEKLPNGVVTVKSHNNKGDERVNGGIAVGDGGYVLTTNWVTQASEFLKVVDHQGEEFIGHVVNFDRRRNIALLEVKGFKATPVVVSTTSMAAGQSIFTALFDQSSERSVMIPGAVGRTNITLSELSFFDHNAGVDRSSLGYPVLNECGTVLGMNQRRPGIKSWLGLNRRTSEGVAYATSTTELLKAAADLGVSISVTDALCKSRVERAKAAEAEARAKSDAAKEAADEAAKSAAAAKQKADSFKKKMAEAKSDRDKIQKAREEADKAEQLAREEAEKARKELKLAKEKSAEIEAERVKADEEAKKLSEDVKKSKAKLVERAGEISAAAKREKLLRLAMIVGGSVALVLILIVFLVARRRSRMLKVTKDELERAPKSAKFECTLTGNLESGKPIAVKLTSLSLGQSGGVVIGRNPGVSEYLVQHEELSQRHARVWADGTLLYVEDLASTNGTKVNGEQVTPEGPCLIDDGDTLTLGPLNLTVLKNRQLRHLPDQAA